ncbi:MAG: hypothetical protein GY743_14285 [Planctomycetaceae bacterium]|nr:hypothetical protein [Planctomycetaceae bacterium]
MVEELLDRRSSVTSTHLTERADDMADQIIIVEHSDQHVSRSGLVSASQSRHQHLPGAAVGPIPSERHKVIEHRIIGNNRQAVRHSPARGPVELRSAELSHERFRHSSASGLPDAQSSDQPLTELLSIRDGNILIDTVQPLDQHRHR